jgi:hypothetical protein
MDKGTLSAIARVTATGPQGPVRGTAFLVGSGLVATALHNVADRSADPPAFFTGITLEFPNHWPTHKTAAKALKFDRDADCVLLECAAPPSCQPLGLQELQRSGGQWETYGFSNMQSLDGLVVDGDVTNHLGKLYGQDAIQLYSKHLAAAIGGDARGLSGGPLLMRNVAVGLMRFALGPPERTVGGVVYACPARFIFALDPALSFQKMPQVRTLLADDQLNALIMRYVVEFAPQRDAFENIVRYALGVELADVTDPRLPFDKIVSDLLNWASRQGLGPMEALLYATTRSRPQNAELRTFCQTHVPSVLNAVNVADLIFKIRLALQALSGLQSRNADVRAIAATYRGELQAMLRQIRVVAQYKGLHSILHDVRQKLEAIDRALGADPKDGKANAGLRRYALEIHDLADNAELKIDGLDTREREKSWINGLHARASDMIDVAKEDASLEDRDQVYNSLRSLVSEMLPRINEALAKAAGSLRLASLIDMVDAVIGKGSPDAQELQQLTAGADAVGALRVRIAGLIKEHESWQAASIELEGANASISHQPQRKFGEWPSFQAKVRALCNVEPEALWSTRLIERLDAWIDATPNAKPDKAERDAGKEAFAVFYGSCNDRFYEVDKDVDRDSAKVVDLALPVERLLNVTPAPTGLNP